MKQSEISHAQFPEWLIANCSGWQNHIAFFYSHCKLLVVRQTSQLISNTEQQSHSCSTHRYQRNIIHNQTVKLLTVLNSSEWNWAIDFISTSSWHAERSNRRLSAICKLKGLNVLLHLLLILYQSIIQLILLSCSTCFFCLFGFFYGILTDRAKLTTNTAASLNDLPTLIFTELHNKAIACIETSTAKDTAHPLNYYFTPLVSRQRYRALRCRRAPFGKSLIPTLLASSP